LPPELLAESLLLKALRAARLWLLTGGVATIACAAIFSWLHADEPGGAGIVRVVSTACLGLACGIARQHTASILPGALLHAMFNFLALAQLRRWVVLESFPRHYTVPTLLTAVAAGCALALGSYGLALWLRAARTAGHAPPGAVDRADETRSDGRAC